MSVSDDALEACELTLKRLQFTGVPNYFGPQRLYGCGVLFSHRGDERRPGAMPRRLAGVVVMRRRDGVDAIPRRLDAIDAAARESLRAAAPREDSGSVALVGRDRRARAARQLYEATRT